MTSVLGRTLKKISKAMAELQAEDASISTAVEIYDYLIIFFTELQSSFPLHKYSDEKELARLRNLNSVPYSSTEKNSRKNPQIMPKRCFDESSELYAESENPEK